MSLKIDQAFTGDFIAQGFGLPIAHENDGYEPTPGTPYVALRIFANAVLPYTIGTHDDTTGLFQFSLNYPEGNGAIPAKTKAETIFAAYPVGRKLAYGGQLIHVTGHQRFDASPADGWFRVVGRINYRAFLTR